MTVRSFLGGVVAVTASLAVATASPVTAQSDDPGVTETELPFGALTLTLIDHSIDVGPGGDVVLTYRIDGRLADAELLFIDRDAEATTPDEPADGDAEAEAIVDDGPIALSIDVLVDDRLDEEDELIGRMGPTALESAFPSPIDGLVVDDARPLIEIDDDGTVTMRLVVPTDVSPSGPDRLGLDDPGLYPLLVKLRAGGEVIARHGTVANRVDPAPDVATVQLAALAAVEQPRTVADDDELAALADDAARITEFAAVTQMPLTVSIPPRVVEVLTAGTSAGAIVGESLRDDTLQSLPATPFDVSAAVAIERDEAFVRQLTLGEERLQAALPGTAVRRDVWLVDRPLSGEAAALLRTLGVRLLVMTESIARATLDPVGSIDDWSRDRLLAVTLPDGSSLPIKVIDRADDQFTTAATDATLDGSSPVEWAIDHLARLRLGIETDAASGIPELEGRGRLLAAPDLGPLDPRLLDELVRLDERTRIHDVVEAGDLASTVAVQTLDPAASLPEVAGPSLAERVSVIESTGVVLLDASSMLTGGDERPARWSELLDTLVSTAYTDADVDVVVDSILAEAEALTSAVVPPEPFSITLTSRDGTIPIEVTNTADEALRVRIVLESQRLVFPDGDPEVLLPADSTTTVEIPVEARSNGTTSVQVTIVTPFGGQLTEPVRITARVQSLSGLAQLITATLVLLLLTWWFNHWRQRRRRDAAGTPTGTTTPPDQPDGSVGSVSA